MSRAVAVADACNLPVHVRTERVAVTIARAVDDITDQVDHFSYICLRQHEHKVAMQNIS
jgi:hypothetical protein